MLRGKAIPNCNYVTELHNPAIPLIPSSGQGLCSSSMETVSSPALSRTISLSPFLPLRHSSLLHKRCSPNSVSFLHHPQFFHYSLFRLPLQASGNRSSVVSAHFGRLSPRRNRLREKLVQQTQVRVPSENKDELDSNLNGQSHSSHKDETFGSNIDHNFLGEAGFEYTNESKSEVGDVRESDLGRKLDDWYNGYKEEIARKSEVGLPSSAVLKNRGRNSGAEIEYEFPLSSSVDQFVNQGRKLFSVGGSGLAKLRMDTFGRVGIVILCSSFIVWVIRKIIVGGKDGQELTREKKEMLRRKVRLRMEKEKEDSKVEVLAVDSELPVRPAMRPKLNKSELMDSISRANANKENVAALSVPSKVPSSSMEFASKLVEIQGMARKAREIERKAFLKSESDDEDNDISQFTFINKKVHSSFHKMEAQSKIEGESTLDLLEDNVNYLGTSSMKDVLTSQSSQGSLEMGLVKEDNFRTLMKADSEDRNKFNDVCSPVEVESTSMLNFRDETQVYELNDNNSSLSDEVLHVNKPRIITSVGEAREYLSQRCENVAGRKELSSHDTISGGDNRSISHPKDAMRSKSHDISAAAAGRLIYEQEGSYERAYSSEKSRSPERLQDVLLQRNGFEPTNNDLRSNKMQPSDVSSNDVTPEDNVTVSSQNWIEKNFDCFEPIARKIGLGFRDNYMVAKDERDSSLTSDLCTLVNEDDELEWMKDDTLSSIVFKVRDNELAGRDPFHMMSEEDKLTFFEGLDKKVEKENEKLKSLHKWVHSRVENLDYGIDGISLYDPPEKIVPRWKGPSVRDDPELLGNIVKHKTEFSTRSSDVLQSSENGTLNCQETAPENALLHRSAKDDLAKRKSTTVKTVIESSDGSNRVGSKEGKEQWEHTKKWSQEFLEVYNRETDPEVRSIMKDMGKDLDKWITQKEITETADLMTRIPKRRRKYIEKKMEKLRKEIEMFGHQAVVSKYREYSEDNEEDYLWWLDLTFVLCIELYTSEDGIQKSGLYSLEMAQDLELDPKPCHVVAFENPTDAKNFCYIIQAHLEMLGNGAAFVVARPPKDAIREAKANGHNITVIRKGQLQLNIDQTLEEVESEITEIGSKMYHDQIMRKHSVDIGSLIKGVIGSGKAAKKRSLKRTIQS